MEALQYIADRKRISVDYLTIPSQQRYVQYFSNMLDGVKPRSEHLLLRRVIMNSIPSFGSNDTDVGCCPYIQLFKNGKLIATAVPTMNSTASDSTGGIAGTDAADKVALKFVTSGEGSVSFSVDCPVNGACEYSFYTL
jgi:tensin